MNHRPIGVFDSGLGGLTIVRALLDLLPGESLVYFGDTARFPYGSKQPEQLRRFAAEIVELLLARDVKMVVAACNSASSVALENLRASCPVPVVGVIEPGVRAALEITEGRLGVIGTQATVSSGAYERVAARLAPEVRVVSLACPGFVELVEAGDLDSPEAYALVAQTLAPLRLAEVDTVILGCTHYPHLARTVDDVMGSDVMLVSSAEETAFEVHRLLDEAGLRRQADGPPRHIFLTSGSERSFYTLGQRFLGPELDTVEGWRWPQLVSRAG